MVSIKASHDFLPFYGTAAQGNSHQVSKHMAGWVPSLTMDTFTGSIAKCGLWGQKVEPEIAEPELWGF